MSERGQKIFKWIVWIVFIITLIVLTFTKVDSLMNPGISRYEWVSILNDGFGFNGYLSEEPYFSDVSIDDEYFEDVQISVDNGIISKDRMFNGSEEATGEFILVTLMRAIGEERLIYYSDTTDFCDVNLIKLAKELEIANNIQKKDSVSEEDANDALLSALDFYTNPSKYPQYCDITYNENVVVPEKSELLSVDLENNVITVSEVPQDLVEGKVLILTNEYGIAFAKKVVGIVENEKDATINLEEVASLAEVAETVSFSGSGDFRFIAEHSADKSSMEASRNNKSNGLICSTKGQPVLLLSANPIVATGFKDWADDVFEYDENSAISIDDSTLSTDIEITFEIKETVKNGKLSEEVVAYIKYKTDGLPTTTYQYTCEGGISKTSVVTEAEGLSFEFSEKEDNDNADKDKEENTSAYANSAKASFMLENFTVNASGYFETLDWNDEKNFLEVMINSDVKLLSSVKGSIEKKTKIGEVEVPIAQTGGVISVGVEFYAVTSVTGELELSYEVKDVYAGIKASVADYNRTGSLISTPNGHGRETVTATAKVELKGGAEVAAKVSCCQFDLVDPGVEVCAVGTVSTAAKITVDDKYADCDLCVNLSVAAPIISLEAAAGEDSALKFILDAFDLTAKAEYELVTKDTAPLKIDYHVETDTNGDIVMLEGGDEVCTHAKQEELKDLLEEAEREAQEELEKQRQEAIEALKRRIEEEIEKWLEQWLLDNCNEC